MRLLLTSSGLTNSSLTDSFVKLVSKPCQVVKVAFIPTAANVSQDRSWMDSHITNLRKAGVAEIDIVDIARLSPQESAARCSAADVVWFSGGNTYFLLDWVRRSGLAAQLPALLKSRLYVGVSAGSMIVGPTIETNAPFFPEEEDRKIEDITGLGLVRFAVVPHLFASNHPNISSHRLEQFATGVNYPIYALDDASGVAVVDGVATIISEGGTRVYNNQVEPRPTPGTRHTLAL